MPRKKAKPPKSKPLAKAPPPPASIAKQKYAAAYWKAIVPELVRIEAITPLHLESLTTICQWWQVYCEQSAWLDKHPDQVFIETEKGYVYENPRLRLRQKAWENLAKLWPKFGLTPKGLAELQTPGHGTPQANLSPLAAFANQKYGVVG